MKEKISNAFRELRRLGYFARQNFMCCQTCGWAEVPEDKADKAVFYHHQDKERLDREGKLYLNWSGDGNLIKSVFEKCGLKVEWNGTDSTRIKVTA